MSLYYQWYGEYLVNSNDDLYIIMILWMVNINGEYMA